MPAVKRIVFWEPTLSPHKTAFIASIARLAPAKEVIYCADQGLDEERKALGWTTAEPDGYRQVIAPDGPAIAELVEDSPNESFHVFSGMRKIPSIVEGLKKVREQGARFAIMSEPRGWEGWAGRLRFVQSWLTEGWLRHNASFILAIGRQGSMWFRSVGYPADRIIPFAYFIAPPVVSESARTLISGEARPLRIGFLGRLVKMKGISDLIAALGTLDGRAELHVGGTGPEESALRNECKQARVAARFHGPIPMTDIGRFLGNLDVLALPSTAKDGWGVVISEALLCGTAVIASDCVGASVLLGSSLPGRCVPGHAPRAIASAISDMESKGQFRDLIRAERQAWALDRLSAEAGARHFLATLAWAWVGQDKPAPFYD